MNSEMNDIHRDAVSDALWDILLKLSASPDLKGFRLVGGTALALHLGHRISVDIDWFTDSTFDSLQTSELLIKEFGLRQAVVVENSVSGEIDGIKVDVIAHRYPWIEDAVERDGVRFASIDDLGSMKLNAIANRGSKKDFWDIAVLLEQSSIEELLSCFKRRYPHANTWQVVRSLTYFDDADIEPDPIVLDDRTWKQVKDQILEVTRNYF